MSPRAALSALGLAVLLLAIALQNGRRTGDAASGKTIGPNGAVASDAAQRPVAGTGRGQRDRPVVRQPAGSTIRPGALVFQELPGIDVDLRGRSVAQAYAELVDAGDAASTRKAAMLLRKCQQRVSYANVPRPIPNFGSGVEWRAFEKRFHEIASECRDLVAERGKVWSALMTQAAEAGDRQARIALSGYPPEPSEGAEKFAEWKTRSRAYLAELAEGGDVEAAQRLAYLAVNEGEDVESLRQAIDYLQTSKLSATRSVDVKFADRAIESIRGKVERLESR